MKVQKKGIVHCLDVVPCTEPYAFIYSIFIFVFMFLIIKIIFMEYL